MARKKPHEEHVNHERWLVSYADFITLLFAFFVVMYSTSSVNEGKMRVLSDSLVASFAGRNKSLAPIQIGKLVRSPYVDETSPVTGANRFIIVAPPDSTARLNQAGQEDALEKGDGFFGGIQGAAGDGDDASLATERAGPWGEQGAESGGAGPGPGVSDETPYKLPEHAANVAGESDQTNEGQAAEMADVSEVTKTVRESMSPLIDLAEVAIRQKQSWLEIELDSSKLFVSGSARIARGAIPTLSKIVELLKQFPNPIQVEGFTDNQPIRTLAFPSNWELSAARSASVVHLFTQEGVDPERMVAIGYGEHRPVADNATVEGRAKNRRVVLVIPADDEIRRILGDRLEVGIKNGG